MIEVQIIDRQISVYVNEEGRRDKILASAQIFVDGKHGYMYSIIGQKFLISINKIIEKLQDRGLEVIEGKMIPIVTEQVKKILGQSLKIIKSEDYGNGVILDHVIFNLNGYLYNE